MRVLYLNPLSQLGGSERSLLDIVEAVRRQQPRFALHVLATEPGPLLDHAAALGAKTHVLPMPERLRRTGDSQLRFAGGLAQVGWSVAQAPSAALASAEYAVRLRRFVRELEPDILHSNGMKFHVLSPLVRGKARLIWHLRDFVGERRLVLPALRGLSRRVDLVLANSRAVAEDAGRALGGLTARVVYNAVDLTQFRPGSVPSSWLDGAASLAPHPGECLRVGLIATYARWKGQDVFLRACRHALDAGLRDVRFFVVGGPIYDTGGSQFSRAELERLRDELGLADVVGFVPFTEDVARVYRSLDLVVHASVRPEPFGRTIAEAMATSRPVIVAAAGGASELFTPGVDAEAFPSGDAHELGEAIVRLARDPERRARMGQAARITAERRFSRERLGREVVEVYTSLCGARRPEEAPCCGPS